MPFGKKPLPDGSTYDFDKVYRVIITRAVQEVGLKPLRADETVGSRLIHSDMFKDLRDRSIVLADLSLEESQCFLRTRHSSRHVADRHRAHVPEGHRSPF